MILIIWRMKSGTPKILLKIFLALINADLFHNQTIQKL